MFLPLFSICFKMLLSRKKITEDLIEMMTGWRHSGFNVYCGPRIQPGEEEAIENLARYIIRAFLSRLCFADRRGFSQERMTYVPEDAKVLYWSKDGKEENMFDALEWSRKNERDASIRSHVLPCSEQGGIPPCGITMVVTVPRLAGSAGENGKNKTRMN